MAVTVNGEAISTEDIEQEMERLRPDYQRYVQGNKGEVDEAQLRQWCTENLIERQLVFQAAAETEIEVPAEELDKAYERAKDHLPGKDKEKRALLEKQMKADRMIKGIADEAPEPTDEETKALYEAEPKRFTQPPRIHVRHIVKHTNQGQDKTQAFLSISNINQELKRGKPFEELAAENSDCPDSAGDLGYFGPGEMVQEFEDVVFAMNTGDVSEPFLTPFGYHIAKVEDKQPEQVAPFDKVKDHIKEELGRGKKQKAVEAFIDSLKSKADIEK